MSKTEARHAAPLPVLCLAGPTGAGKTAAALALAARLNAEVINADSRQVYADFPCITAQPSAEERAACPHHLYGFLPTTEKISAGQWADLALAKVRELHARGKTALLVGGTGLYFQTLLHGIAQIPRLDPAITRSLEARIAVEGPAALHSALQAVDPAYAARIHPHDRQRITRALEVWQGTGKAFSWWHSHAMAAPLCRGPLLVFDAKLDWLEPRLARRIDLMLEAGALEEARAAYAHCADTAAPGWSGIGAAELLAFLQGRMDLETCRQQWFRNTRAYAKRQITWFKARENVTFVPPDELSRIVDTACKAFASYTI